MILLLLLLYSYKNSNITVTNRYIHSVFVFICISTLHYTLSSVNLVYIECVRKYFLIYFRGIYYLHFIQPKELFFRSSSEISFSAIWFFKYKYLKVFDLNLADIFFQGGW